MNKICRTGFVSKDVERRLNMKNWKSGRGHYIVTMVGTLFALELIVIYTFNSFYELAKEDAITIGDTAVKERTQTLNNYYMQSFEAINITEQMVDYMAHHGHDAQEIEEYIVDASPKYNSQINENFTGIYGWIKNTYIDGVGWTPGDDYVPTERVWYTDAIEKAGEAALVSPYIDAQTNQVIISLSKMLSDGESVISLDRTLDDIQVIAEEINLINAERYKSGI